MSPIRPTQVTAKNSSGTYDEAPSTTPPTRAQTTADPAPSPEPRKPVGVSTQHASRQRAAGNEAALRNKLNADVPAADDVSEVSAAGIAALKEHHPLSVGDNSPEVQGEVKELQAFLKEKGFYQGEPTGSFDADTAKAVRAFQKDNGLKVDGIVGQQTWGAVLGVKVDPGLKLLKPWAHSFAHQAGPVTEGPAASSLRAKALAMHGQPFLDKLDAVAGRIGVTPDAMLKVMNSESGLRTDAVNPNGGATGLIQFMPATARGLGTTTDAIRNMSGVEQLDLVERYYRPFQGRLHNATDLYTVTFYPAALGKPDDYAIGGNNAGMIARANPSFDIDGDGVITMQNFREFCRRKFGGS